MLFKSFTGLSVQQFDGVYKEIKSKYEKYEIKRLSSNRRERDIGGCRETLQTGCQKQRVIMVLVYYRLYTSSPIL